MGYLVRFPFWTVANPDKNCCQERQVPFENTTLPTIYPHTPLRVPAATCDARTATAAFHAAACLHRTTAFCRCAAFARCARCCCAARFSRLCRARSTLRAHAAVPNCLRAHALRTNAPQWQETMFLGIHSDSWIVAPHFIVWCSGFAAFHIFCALFSTPIIKLSVWLNLLPYQVRVTTCL